MKQENQAVQYKKNMHSGWESSDQVLRCRLFCSSRGLCGIPPEEDDHQENTVGSRLAVQPRKSHIRIRGNGSQQEIRSSGLVPIKLMRGSRVPSQLCGHDRQI